MIKKVKYFIAITILTAIAVIFLIVAAAFFSLALAALKSGGVGGAFGGLFTLLFFCMSLGFSAIMSLISLPFTVISVKRSEQKVYPTVLLVINAIIIIIAIIFVILLATQAK